MTLARSRRMLLVAVGLSVAVAVFPATAAHAEQPPAGETQLTQAPTFQPPVDLIQPGDPVLIDPPVTIPFPPGQLEPQPPDGPVGPGDLANPTENPDPEPEPPDDLANPTENPEPQPPDVGDQSIPTPERVDTGLGGEADRSQGPAVPVVAFPLALAVLLLALAAGWRLGSARSAR